MKNCERFLKEHVTDMKIIPLTIHDFFLWHRAFISPRNGKSKHHLGVLHMSYAYFDDEKECGCLMTFDYFQRLEALKRARTLL